VHGMSRGLIAVVLLALAVSGCGSEGSSTSFGTPPKPGYKTGSFGSAEAVGYLVREGFEGGFWAVTDVPPGTSSGVQPKILAVLLPGSHDLAGIAVLEGKLVWVAGRVPGDVSTRMAGPEIAVDALDPVGTQ